MVRRKKTKTTVDKQDSQELYDKTEVGMIATKKTGKIGIVTEKIITDGGSKSIWWQEPGYSYPTLESMDVFTKVEHKPTAVVLFSGGGGVECGLVDAGIEPLLAVEHNPDKPELSEAMSDAHEANFSGCKVIRRTVQELALEDFPGFPQEPDILWASPMCSNFSDAKKGATEQPSDIEAARAVLACIKQIKPKHFLIENVRRYANSESWKEIELVISSLGYNLKIPQIVDMSDYGVPQARKRFIAWASRDDQVSLKMPPKTAKISWYEAIEDLIPDLPDSELTKGQNTGVRKFLEKNKAEPLLIFRIGGRAVSYKIVPSSKPSLTILRSHFTDQNDNNRNKFADIWLPDGTTKQVTIECVRRLQSFPDWYEFPESVAVAGSILGYSVPPKFVELFLKPIGQVTRANHIAELDWLEKCQQEIDEGEVFICQSGESVSQQSKKALDEAMEALQGNGSHALTVQTSSKTDEHYTPDDVIEAAIATLETIDLDPCSNSHDHPNIPASNHYTIEDDGLSKSWAIGEGRIYLNPPYSETAKWVDKLIEEYEAGGVKQAVTLVKSATDTKWYQKLDKFPKCLWNGRLTFKGNDSPAPFASSIFYLGNHPERFTEAFSKHGRIHRVPITHVPTSPSPIPHSPTPTALNLSEIRRDGGTQPREKLDMAHVATLKEAIEDGAELDRVIVFYDGENYWLADGFHRCKASEESGLEDIPVIIHQGTRRDAVLYSVGANAEHKAAKPRSRADKRRAVTMLLNDPEWSKWSNREIARQCKVSESLVRTILTAFKRSEEPKTRTYTTKHGTTATMQVGNIGKGEQETGNGKISELPDSDVENSQLLSANNGNGTLSEGNDYSNNGNNGNGHHTSVPKSPPVEDYVIGFLSNMDQMSAEQLIEVRDRVDQRLQTLKCPTFPKNGKSLPELVLH